MGAVKTSESSPIRRWAYAAAVALLIFAASSRSTVAGPRIEHFDKVVHFSIYGLLGTLVVRALGAGRWGRAVLLVSLYGASDEWHQSFVPGRTSELADWVADTLGATVAIAAYSRWAAYRERLERPLWRRPVAAPLRLAEPIAAPRG